jgi:hypothetical protein
VHHEARPSVQQGGFARLQLAGTPFAPPCFGVRNGFTRRAIEVQRCRLPFVAYPVRQDHAREPARTKAASRLAAARYHRGCATGGLLRRGSPPVNAVDRIVAFFPTGEPPVRFFPSTRESDFAYAPRASDHCDRVRRKAFWPSRSRVRGNNLIVGPVIEPHKPSCGWTRGGLLRHAP